MKENLATTENRPSEVQIHVNQEVKSTYTIYLGDTVGHNSARYLKLLQTLKNAQEGDIIHIHMSNFGGACHVGFRIAHNIKASKAKVHMHVEAPCYSMGAILAVCGDELTMCPGTFLMFHNYSGGESGKGGEMKMAIKEYSKHFRDSLEYFCSPFLTEDEITKLVKDIDVYIHARNYKKRAKRHFKNKQ